MPIVSLIHPYHNKISYILELECTLEYTPEYYENLTRASRSNTGTTLVHGDYRIGNLMLRPEDPRILAVLDWEISTLGHPICDLAYVVRFR